MYEYGLVISVIIIAIIFVIYDARNFYHNRGLSQDKEHLIRQNIELNTQNSKLHEHNKYLQLVKEADENIFDYIRCINIPQAPTCKDTGDETTVCRSRLTDCNKYKLVLENDPVTLQRMKVATNLYTDANKPDNPSDLTYPVRSGWFY
jgi:hypothetical protein